MTFDTSPFIVRRFDLLKLLAADGLIEITALRVKGYPNQENDPSETFVQFRRKAMCG